MDVRELIGCELAKVHNVLALVDKRSSWRMTWSEKGLLELSIHGVRQQHTTERSSYYVVLPQSHSRTGLDGRLVGATQGQNAPHEVPKCEWLTIFE